MSGMNYNYVCAKCSNESCVYSNTPPEEGHICGACQHIRDLEKPVVKIDTGFKSRKNTDGRWDPNGTKTPAQYFGKALTSDDRDVWKGVPDAEGKY